MKTPFEILEHPSDLGIEAHGSSMQEVFRNAAKGLMSVITGSSQIGNQEKRFIEIHAKDRENLLVKWLTEILFLYDAEKFLSVDSIIDLINDTALKAAVLGEQYNPRNHELSLDVKAITYHQLMVEERDGLWTARVFVDV